MAAAWRDILIAFSSEALDQGTWRNLTGQRTDTEPAGMNVRPALTKSGHLIVVLLTNATCLLSGDQEGTLIVPWPPYT
jgi:hypothetical protein